MKELTIKYSRPVEQIGIIWTYSGIEDLQGYLDDPIPEELLKNEVVKRLEHHPNDSGMGGKIIFFYDDEGVI